MKNIIDYLKERKNISFLEDPFNEVDGLVLAELVYSNFNQILDENSDMSIEELSKEFWNLHTEKEIMSSPSTTKMAPFLMKEMEDSSRFKGMRVKKFVEDSSLEDIMQFAALTFELPDGSVFISFRGTDGTVVGWAEDFKFSFSTTEGHKMAVDYINEYHKNQSKPIRVGGHSKGGNLAVFASAFCDTSIRKKIVNVYSYDGPGFLMNIIDSKEYKDILPRVLSVVPESSLVGTLLTNQYKTIITNADGFFVFQHDDMQWHIVDNHFEELESRSEISLFFEEVLRNWQLRCDENEREEIFEAIFSLITDNELLKEDDEKLTPAFFYNVIKKSSKLSGKDKSLLLDSISEVFSSISDVTKRKIKENLSTALKHDF
ncbi:MAG: DUF2974 domain-containing protein [Lachnospiraceae bacterium]|nr:DUF2974 domain-containing protein [Lachnospiraceae bacterium]